MAPPADDAPPLDAWRGAWAAAAPRLAALAAAAPPPWPRRTFRSSQLDAARMDDELALMLQEQAGRAFALLPPARVAAAEPELRAALRAAVFALSVWRGRATPGSELLGLKYADARAGTAGGGVASAAAAAAAVAAAAVAAAATGSPSPGGLSRRKRVLFGLGYVLLPYAWERASRLAAERSQRAALRAPLGEPPSGGAIAARRAMRAVEAAVGVAALLNAAAFLRGGGHRSLLERALGLRLAYRSPTMARAVSFEYLNRQLVWHGVSELLLFLLPLLSAARLRGALRGLLARVRGPAALAGASASTDAGGAPGAPGAKAAAAAVTSTSGNACPVCAVAEPGTPFCAAPCGHVFCFYCLRASTLADAAFACPLDGRRVTAMRRYRPPAAALAPGDGG